MEQTLEGVLKDAEAWAKVNYSKEFRIYQEPTKRLVFTIPRYYEYIPASYALVGIWRCDKPGSPYIKAD